MELENTILADRTDPTINVSWKDAEYFLEVSCLYDVVVDISLSRVRINGFMFGITEPHIDFQITCSGVSMFSINRELRDDPDSSVLWVSITPLNPIAEQFLTGSKSMMMNANNNPGLSPEISNYKLNFANNEFNLIVDCSDFQILWTGLTEHQHRMVSEKRAREKEQHARIFGKTNTDDA
jgi:hypothetical protein